MIADAWHRESIWRRLRGRSNAVGHLDYERAHGFVERFCESRGILALHLEVDRGNLHAQALYRKAGYHDRNNYLLTKWLSDESKDE